MPSFPPTVPVPRTSLAGTPPAQAGAVSPPLGGARSSTLDGLIEAARNVLAEATQSFPHGVAFVLPPAMRELLMAVIQAEKER